VRGRIIALVLSIALDVGVGVDGRLALAIIEQENAVCDPKAVHQNKNGTRDLGIMQINSASIPGFLRCYWDKGHDFDWTDPADNIYLGLRHLKDLLSMPGVNEWQAVIFYNAGTAWLRKGIIPPDSAIDYANAVITRWNEGRKR
jgi:soluble lytic murein transglycosylase-like protein